MAPIDDLSSYRHELKNVIKMYSKKLKHDFSSFGLNIKVRDSVEFITPVEFDDCLVLGLYGVDESITSIFSAGPVGYTAKNSKKRIRKKICPVLVFLEHQCIA